MKKTIVCLTLMLCLLAGPAWALRVEFENVGVLDGRTMTGEALEIRAGVLDVLGRMEDGSYLIAANDDAYMAEEAALYKAFGQAADLSSVEPLAQTPSLQKGDRGDAVRAFQSALVKLGYLTGSADGSYGNKTVTAVRALQERLLPGHVSEQGAADAATQLLALALASDAPGDIVLAGEPITPEIKYPEICARLDSDLSGFCTGAYALAYDDMEDVGFIALSPTAQWSMDADAEIDRLAFEWSLGLAIAPNDAGRLAATPVLQLRSQGARRPYLQSCILKIGETRYDIAVEETEGELLGRDVAETARVALGETGLDMLLQAAQAGNAQLRFVCKYRQFDVVFDAAAIPALKSFAENALDAGLASAQDAVLAR